MVQASGTCTQRTSENPTVVLLHVDPKVLLFGAVCKCAVPDVDALLPGRHVHADLEREGRGLEAGGRGCGPVCKLPNNLQRQINTEVLNENVKQCWTLKESVFFKQK